MSSEHDLTAILVDVDITELVGVFEKVGFRHDEPQGSEHKLADATIELDVYPYHAGDSDESGSFLVSGSVECESKDLRTVGQRLAGLFLAAGARYLLEIERPEGDGEIVLKHVDFSRPARRRRLEAPLILETGNENLPYGLDRITVEPGGAFVYERCENSQVTNRAEGLLTSGTLIGLASELRAARFPRVPDHDLSPGGGYLKISSPGLGSAMISMRGGRNFVGYGHLIAYFREWIGYLCIESSESSPPAGMTVASRVLGSKFARGF